MRRFPGEQLVEHAGQRVQIAPCVDDTVAGRLLGAHVVRRANRDAAAGESSVTGVLDGQRDTEVGHNRQPTREHDVRGFYIAVDDALLMRVLKTTRDAGDDA